MTLRLCCEKNSTCDKAKGNINRIKIEAYEEVLKLARTRMMKFWGYPMKKGSRYTLHDMGHKFEDELEQRIKEMKEASE